MFYICRVFANADTLFYYPAFARPTKKSLSLDEIKRLLAQATGKPKVQSGDVTRNVTVVHGEEENQPHVEAMTVTDLDREDAEGTQEYLYHDKTEVPQHGAESILPNQEGAADTQQEEAFTIGQELVLQEVADGEVCGTESAMCNFDHDGQDTAGYEGHLQLDEGVEVAISSWWQMGAHKVKFKFVFIFFMCSKHRLNFSSSKRKT